MLPSVVHRPAVRPWYNWLPLPYNLRGPIWPCPLDTFTDRVTPTCGTTKELPNGVNEISSDSNIQQALLVRHLMGHS